jgi:hypothetical protein
LFTLRAKRTLSSLISIGAIVTGFIHDRDLYRGKRFSSAVTETSSQLADHRRIAGGFRPQARRLEPDDAA